MEQTTPETDPVLDGLQALLKEFQLHKERLGLRRNEIRSMLADGKLSEPSELGKLVSELYEELADTALSFQEDVTRVVYTAFAESPGDDEEEDDEEEAIDDEVDSVLLPGDAATLHGIITDHYAMVTEILKGWQGVDIPAAERERVQGMQRTAKKGLELIEEITLEEGDDEGDGDEGDEDEDADETAPVN